MSDTLAELAEQVIRFADQTLAAHSTASLREDLNDRLDQLQTLNATIKDLAKAVELIRTVQPKYETPKRRLSPRLKSLRSLEPKILENPALLVKSDTFDHRGTEEALKEAEEHALRAWADFLKPDRSPQGLESLADDPAIGKTVSDLQKLRQSLVVRQQSLPTKRSDIAEVKDLKKKFAELSDKVASHGYDDDVLEFLGKTRERRGAALSEAFANAKVRKWLESGQTASGFRIVHASALNSQFL